MLTPKHCLPVAPGDILAAALTKCYVHDTEAAAFPLLQSAVLRMNGCAAVSFGWECHLSQHLDMNFVVLSSLVITLRA